jgi:hypothetical protein
MTTDKTEGCKSTPPHPQISGIFVAYGILLTYIWITFSLRFIDYGIIAFGIGLVIVIIPHLALLGAIKIEKNPILFMVALGFLCIWFLYWATHVTGIFQYFTAYVTLFGFWSAFWYASRTTLRFVYWLPIMVLLIHFCFFRNAKTMKYIE